MSIARQNPNREASEQTPVTILERVIEPTLVASKKFYQTNPKEFLELGIVFIFILLTFLGQLSVSLPWGWYLALSLWVLFYFNAFNVIKKTIKKLNKK